MTREEAIKILNRDDDNMRKGYFCINDFLAIEVLKSEQPSDDCVNRQAILKEIPILWNSKGDKDYCMETLRDFVTELPPVTPTRKKCKWILYDYRTIAPREHGNIPNPYWRIPVRYKTELKYCPYCGGEIDYSEIDAEMESEE